MINTVEKIYTETGFSYKVIYQDGTEWSVPHSEGNRHYQAIQEWIAEGNTVIDNGGNN
jgi:hypothetical protein